MMKLIGALIVAGLTLIIAYYVIQLIIMGAVLIISWIKNLFK